MLYKVFNYSTDSDIRGKAFLVSDRCSSKCHLLLQVLFFFVLDRRYFNYYTLSLFWIADCQSTVLLFILGCLVYSSFEIKEQ